MNAHTPTQDQGQEQAALGPAALLLRRIAGLAVLLLAVLALHLLGAWPAAHAQSAKPEAEGYRFSPVNQANIATAAAYWNPIVAYVSERSGVKLTLKLGRTSADTTNMVLAQEVEFVFSNHLFSPEREKLGWKVFGRRLTPPIHGQIVVPEGSDITSIDQLEGRDMAFPGPEALVAYKLPYSQLLQRKIKVKPVFAGNMDGAFAQLFAGKVAAVGANSQLTDGYAKREGRAFRVLWSSEPMHDLALMASSKVPKAEVEAVAQAFAGMHSDPKGHALLVQVSKQIGLTEQAYFIRSDGSEYAPYRRFFDTAPPELR